jgi:hypothetical protein
MVTKGLLEEMEARAEEGGGFSREEVLAILCGTACRVIEQPSAFPQAEIAFSRTGQLQL